jgi:hypothetical protein
MFSDISGVCSIFSRSKISRDRYFAVLVLGSSSFAECDLELNIDLGAS